PHHPPLLTRCREGNALSTLSWQVGRAHLPPFPSLEWGRAPLAFCTVPVHGTCLLASSEVGKRSSCTHDVLAVGRAHLPCSPYADVWLSGVQRSSVVS